MLHRSRPRLPPSAFALRRSRNPRTPWRGTPDSPQPAQRGSSLYLRPSQRCVWDASAAGPVQSRRHRGNFHAPRCTVALSPTPAFCARTSHDTRTSHAQVLNLAALPDGMLQASLMLSQSPVEDLQEYVMGHPVQVLLKVADTCTCTNGGDATRIRMTALLHETIEMPACSRRTLSSSPSLSLPPMLSRCCRLVICLVIHPCIHTCFYISGIHAYCTHTCTNAYTCACNHACIRAHTQ